MHLCEIDNCVSDLNQRKVDKSPSNRLEQSVLRYLLVAYCKYLRKIKIPTFIYSVNNFKRSGVSFLKVFKILFLFL